MSRWRDREGIFKWQRELHVVSAVGASHHSDGVGLDWWRRARVDGVVTDESVQLISSLSHVHVHTVHTIHTTHHTDLTGPSPLHINRLHRRSNVVTCHVMGSAVHIDKLPLTLLTFSVMALTQQFTVYCRWRSNEWRFSCYSVTAISTKTYHPFSVKPLDSKSNYSGTPNNTKLVHWPWWVGCYI